jgi:hypothetical protein
MLSSASKTVSTTAHSFLSHPHFREMVSPIGCENCEKLCGYYGNRIPLPTTRVGSLKDAAEFGCARCAFLWRGMIAAFPEVTRDWTSYRQGELIGSLFAGDEPYFRLRIEKSSRDVGSSYTRVDFFSDALAGKKPLPNSKLFSL